MSYGFAWIALGILFGIMEFFLQNFFFIIGSICAILIGILIQIYNIPSQNWILISGLFTILRLQILISKYYLFHKIKNIGGNNDNLLNFNEIYIIQNINGQNVFYAQGKYRDFHAQDNINSGDSVKIIEFKDNKYIVKKMF